MTTSNYMPAVVVEIAFGSGYATPAASRVWTDVSDDIEHQESIVAALGRGDERSTADANSLSLTLDNTDGRFTAGLASSPYYPDVRIGTPIRVTSTPVGGTDVVRFVGFVDEWPVAWDGSDEYATAQITATSRLARIGFNAELRSIIEETILTTDPVSYYPLGEAQGATSASDISGNNVAPLTLGGSGAAVVFGTATGPGTDGLTAASFTGGQYLVAPDPGAAASFSMFVLTTGGSATLLYGERMVSFGGASVLSNVSATLSGSTLSVTMLATNGNTAALTGSLSLNATHHVAVTASGATAELYVDGVLVDSDPLGGTVSAAGARIGDGLTGVIAHLAFGALDAAEAADVAAAGLTGFAGESSDARIARYAAIAGVPAADVALEPGVVSVAHVETTGTGVVEAMRVVEATEGGVLFDAADGTLTFHNRSHRYTPTGVTLDMGAQLVGAEFSPKLDRSALANDVSVSTGDGTLSARVVDSASRDYYGPAAVSREVAATSWDALFQAASWDVARYAEPAPRVSSLTVNVLDFVGSSPSVNDILALTVGDLITVTNQPAQAPSSTGYYFVEGYTETIGPESYEITFNVSPGEPYTNVARFDDAAHGFDSGAIFAY